MTPRRSAPRSGAKLGSGQGILCAIFGRLIGKERWQRSSHAWRRSVPGQWFLRRDHRRAHKLARNPANKGLFAALLCAELNYRRILHDLAPDVVCLSEDIPGTFSAPFIRAARRKGIPSVIIPFTIPNALELAEACLARKTSVAGAARRARRGARLSALDHAA